MKARVFRTLLLSAWLAPAIAWGDASKLPCKETASTKSWNADCFIKGYADSKAVKGDGSKSDGSSELGAMFGVSNSAQDVVAEALQILGQIVVDRASTHAYTKLKEKLTKLLKCDPEGTLPDQRKSPFPETCTVLQSLRIEDVASSEAVLEGALVRDVLALALGRAPTDELTAEVLRVLDSIMLPALARSRRTLTDSTAQALAGEIVSVALSSMLERSDSGFCVKTGQGPDLASRSTILAAAGLLKCEINSLPDNPEKAFSSCNFEEALRRFSLSSPCPDEKLGDRDRILTHARSIGEHLFKALTISKADSPRVRLTEAADGFFEASCLRVSFGLGCDGVKDDYGTPELYRRARAIAVARSAVAASLDRDTNSLIIAALRALEIAIGTSPDLKDHKRALALLAALIQYAQTYAVVTTAPTGAQAGAASQAALQDAHDRRTKILESLTQEMTNRELRDGDWIASLGGSLRLVGGARFGRTVGGTPARALAPLISLPLGFGLQSPGSHLGFHAEIGVVDLGQYLSFDQTGAVARPDLAAALSPSLSLGVFFLDKQIPATATLGIGYTPQYRFIDDPAAPRGAFNVTLSLGFFVPLLDFN